MYSDPRIHMLDKLLQQNFKVNLFYILCPHSKNDIGNFLYPLVFYSKDNFRDVVITILAQISSLIFLCFPASGDVERTNSSPSHQRCLQLTEKFFAFMGKAYFITCRDKNITIKSKMDYCLFEWII